MNDDATVAAQYTRPFMRDLACYDDRAQGAHGRDLAGHLTGVAAFLGG